MPTVTLQQLNDQEAALRAELEALEAQLNREMERRNDPNNPFTANLTLKIICRHILAVNKELVRIKDAQIQSLQALLRSYGA
jgi:hypothetical protein